MKYWVPMATASSIRLANWACGAFTRKTSALPVGHMGRTSLPLSNLMAALTRKSSSVSSSFGYMTTILMVGSVMAFSLGHMGQEEV